MPAEAIKQLNPTKTDPPPNLPASAPELNGTRNCPKRFPKSRIDIAIALSSTGDFLETIAIVRG